MSTRSLLILGVGVLIALFSLSFALKRKEPPVRLEASVFTKSTNSGVLEIQAKLSGIQTGTSLSLEFAFPSEAIPVSHVAFKGAQQHSVNPRIERDREGIAIHFPRYEIISTAPTIELTYQIVIGQSLTTVLSRGGPRYGYADDKYVAAQLDYVLPLILLPRTGLIHYFAELHGEGYQGGGPFNSVDGHTYEDGTYRTVIAIGPFKTIKGQVNNILIPTGRVIDPKLTFFVDHISAKFGRLFGTEGHVPSVLAMPSGDEESFFPMRSAKLVAMDLLPLTPERAVRLGGVFASALLRDTPNVKRFSKSDEFWLVEGLPRYYGYRSAADVGLLDTEQIADSVSRTTSQHPRLSHWAPSEVSAGIIAESGALTLYKLDSILKDHRVSVDTVVGRFFHSWLPISFFNSVTVNLGIREAKQFWNDYVANTRPIILSSPLELAKRPSNSPAGAEVSPFRLVVTSNVDGYLELCGCKLDQAGGASRRMSYLASKRGRESLQFELGDFLSAARQSSNSLENLEATFQVGLMKSAGYDAIVVGSHEMTRLPALGRSDPAFISGNAPGFLEHKFVTIGRQRLRVVGWVDSPVIERYRNLIWLSDSDYKIDRLRQVLRDAAREADGVILMGKIRPATIRLITQENPKLIAILSNFGSDQQPGYINNTYVMFVVGSKYAVLTVAGTLRGTTIEVSGIDLRRLDDSVPDDDATKRRLDAFYNSPAFIEATVRASPNAGEAAPHLRGVVGTDSFVGSRRCFACHPAQQQHWRKTGHSTAFATMYRTRRNHHPGCVQCHVTGFGEPSGYSMASRLPALENVGCETCHGPGHDHVEHPRFDNVVRSPRRHVCQTCHTSEHSSFDERPEEYMKKVFH